MPDKSARPHLLILRLSALGDVAMTLPAIYSLARAYPHLRITVATRPFFARLFINRPENVELFEVDTRGDHHGTKGLLRLTAQLRALRPTHVADLHDLLRSRVIRTALAATGAVTDVVRKQRSQRKHLTVHKSREFTVNFVQRYADVFARLGFPVELTFRSLFEGTPLDSVQRSGVGLAPFARYATKTYPPELMEQVARQLTDAGHRVYLFGAPGPEKQTLQRWQARNPALTVVAGTLAIEQELELMARLQVMVSMDSANMHLASLVATPVVSVWGSTLPQCGFMGYRQSIDNAVALDLPCQPCSIAGLEECPLGHTDCLRRLPPTRLTAQILHNLPT